MASRKEQKEQARAARIAQEQEAAAKAQRTRRLQVFGGVIAIAVVVIVVVIALSVGGSKSTSGSSLTTDAKAKAAAAYVATELKNIPQSGTTLGSPSAKVTLTYFGDLQCPICADFTKGIGGGGLPQFIQNDVRHGKVKIVYRSFCTASCNNTSVSNPQQLFNTQQVAAYAAGKQNKFWNYAEIFYREQGTEGTPYVTSGYLSGIAQEIPGLNMSAWQSARKDQTLHTQVNTDNSVATTDGIQATPALVIKGPKGIQSLGAGILTYAQLEAGVKAVS